MVKKNGKLSVNDLYKAAGKTAQEVVVEVNGVSITVTPRLPFIVMKEAVARVADACFDDAGDYMPENKEFALRYVLFELYTNLTLPQNIERAYDVMFNDDLYNSIIQSVDAAQWRDITGSVCERIRARLDFDRKQARESVRDVYESIKQLGENIAPIFENLTTEDVQNVMGAINGTEFDEKKLVSAYFDVKKEREADENGTVA